MAIISSIFFIYTAPRWRFGISYLFILPSYTFAFYLNNSFLKRKILKSLKQNNWLVTLFPFSIGVFFIFASSFLISSVEKSLIVAIERGNISNKESVSTLIAPKPALSFIVNKLPTGKIDIDKFHLIKHTNNKFIYFTPQIGDQCWNSHIMCSPHIHGRLNFSNGVDITNGFINR